MKKRIFHETVNKKIIESLDFDEYYCDVIEQNKSMLEYSIDMTIDGYKFEVIVTIEDGIIEKDRNYYGHKNGQITEFQIMPHPNQLKRTTLQDLFNNWLDDFQDWMEAQKKEAKEIEETKDWLNKNR